MSSEFEITFDALIAGRIKHANGSLAIADVDALGKRIVAELIGIAWKLHRVDEPVGVSIEDLARSIALARDHDPVQVRKVGNHLRLTEICPDAVPSPASLNFEHLHTVIAINGGKDSASLVVHRHMIEAALDVRHRDNPHQNERCELIVRWTVLCPGANRHE